jgi:hypothetical protein
MELIARVHLIERDERERDQLRRRKPKRKTPSTHGLDGPVRKALAYGGGWLGQRPTGPVRLAGLKARNEQEEGFLD